MNDRQVNQFIDYYELLIDWNNKINLTSIVEFEDVIIKHFIDSASILNFYNVEKCRSMIDVGTGAGFPGIPIKILVPDIELVLLDSLNKRINFLNEVIYKLGIDNCKAIHSRAEDLAILPEYREKFDLCVSRAVSNLSTLSEYCLPFVKTNGYFISYKSSDIDDEYNSSLNAIKKLNAKCERIEKFEITNTDISRSFIFIKKNGKTNNKYPRKNNLPKKNPL